VKKHQEKSSKRVYDARTVSNDLLTADRYKGKNDYERATDELLSGAQKEKKKRKKKPKQQKIIKPQYSFHPASGRTEREYREYNRDNNRGGEGGRGRGGQRGRGGFGGFGGGSRGGFGSRGRGRRNDDTVNENNGGGVPQPHRQQPQYRQKNTGDLAGPPTQHNDQTGNVPAPPPTN